METNHHTDSHLHPTEMENPGYLAEMSLVLFIEASLFSLPGHSGHGLL